MFNFFSKTLYRILLILFLVGLASYLYWDSRPPKTLAQSQEQIKLIIKDGESLPTIAERLYKENVIKSEALFRLYLGAINLANEIRPGIYYFDSPPTLLDIINKLASKKPDKPAMSVTIPEGFTREEIYDRVKFYLPNLNKDKFMKLTDGLEGQLFPDTYYLQSTMKEEDIVKLMHDEFLDKTAFLNSQMKYNNLTFDQVLVLASILEGEANSTGTEMQNIAGVLYNRLKNNEKLQVDVSPYTYKEKGLPTEPINNPGLDSIYAAINPIANKYMYYLHDATGTIHYAKSYNEHLHNIWKYLKSNK